MYKYFIQVKLGGDLARKVVEIAKEKGKTNGEIVRTIVANHLEFIDRGAPMYERIIEEVCNYYTITKGNLISKVKFGGRPKYRHTAMYILNEYGYSPSEIGAMLNLDHSSVYYGISKVQGELDLNEKTGIYPETRHAYETIKSRV